MKIEIRLTNYDKDYDVVFTQSNITKEEEFNFLVCQLRKLFMFKEDILNFKELED